MADDDAQSGATKPKKEKPKTAVEGNAPGGEQFRDEAKPFASGDGAVLGNQVEARNQALGLTPDPGPVLVGEGHDTLNWRNPKAGETLNEANPEGVTVMQRHSTAPDWFSQGGNTSEVKLGAHVIGLESKASDMYNKDGRDGSGYPMQSAEHFGGKQAAGADADPFVQTADGLQAGKEPVSV